MAADFRYRFVDFGTSFTGDPRNRAATCAVESPGTLFANELATDVGGTCWGANEPLPVIDHHFLRDAQFPCAAAAVLHKAALIRQRFGNRPGTLWLVTHHEPDFDALCSMYLARWIVVDPAAVVNWEEVGLHPGGWLDLPTRQKINWLSPDLSAVPPEHRWAFLLASYASVLEMRHRISCPRERTLRSILYAALKRGRDYLNLTSGATEFFDEVRAVLQQQQLNPVFDSVLENSQLFAPELAMLDREAESYQRDMLRARRSTVYLPESEAPTPDFFKHPRQLGLHDHRNSSDVDAEHLLLADTFRIPTDGIFLRDPECLLFKEWTRLDLENSALGAGFEFTAIALSNGRPQAGKNKTDYIFSIDPERANGRHLYTVWSRLQTEEVEALKANQHEVLAAPDGSSRRVSNQPTATLESLLADPWTGGQNQFGTSVGTPHRGTLLGPAGVRSDLRDDPVSEAVRTELEGSIYSAASLVAGPEVTVFDFAGSKEGVDIEPRQYNLNAPLDIPAPPESYFRFASIRLRADVPITNPNLTLQIGETLWQVLYPEMPGSTPSNFVTRHLFISAGSVGVWGDRGIAVAQKRDFAAGASAPDRQATELRDDFAAMVSLARDVDLLTAHWNRLSDYLPTGMKTASLPEREIDVRGLEAIASNGEELARRAAQVKHSLTLPDRDLFRRFYEAINVDQLLETLRDLTHAATEHLRRYQLAEQAKQIESRADGVARVQSKLEWLEVFIVGFFAVGIIDVITRHVNLGGEAENALVLLGGPLFIGFTAWILKPWRRKKTTTEARIDRPVWILIAVAVACVIAWLAGLAHLWTK
jgi:hypothetical protein